jgi:hypothetical protein
LGELAQQPSPEISSGRRFFGPNATSDDPSCRRLRLSLEIYDRLYHDHVYPCRDLFLSNVGGTCSSSDFATCCHDGLFG